MTRSTLRDRFLASHGLAGTRIEALDSDASNRRYFRLPIHGLLLMDAPPPGERPVEFVQITELLTKLGARVPGIRASDTERGFVLLEDLGDDTFSRLLDRGQSPGKLYHLAVQELISLQINHRRNPVGNGLPGYDESTALKEAVLFTEWYLPVRLGRKLEHGRQNEFLGILSRLFRSLPPLEPVLVHRDFHVDNLLLVGNRCAMLDYQDALLGSPVYDLVSLLEDARRDVDPTLRTELTEQWCLELDISPEHHRPHAAFWGAQRHCKVAGIFVRLWLRDGKPGYLRHLDRVLSLLTRQLESEEYLSPLHSWLEDYLHPAIQHDLTDGFSTVSP